MSTSSIENQIITNEKKLYTYDDNYQEKYLQKHPWTSDETHFKKVFISTLAAMKIVDHSIRGGKFEICGYLMGFAYEGIFFVLDAVEMPLIGTDSRVEIAGQMGDKAIVYSMNFS